MKHPKMVIGLIMTATLLIGCSPTNRKDPLDTASSPTVEDIFQVPNSPTVTDTTPNNPRPSSGTVPTEDAPPPLPNGGSFGGSLSAGPSQVLQDGKGAYMTYNGGEMELPFHINASGSVCQKEIGILLFIDGQPQPYRTDGSEYAYVHLFRVPNSGLLETTFWFVPITGKQGDELEFYALSLLDPNRALSENGQGPSITNTPPAGFRLKYQEAPAAASHLQTSLCFSDTALSFENTTYAEVGSWSERDLLERNESHLSINGITDNRSCIVYGVSADTEISLRFEIWGSPYVHYGVIFFVENQPVFYEKDTSLFIVVRSGQKTVIEASLSIADFDGECPVYAVLVPRNYRTSEVLTVCMIDTSRVFFLTEADAPL